MSLHSFLQLENYVRYTNYINCFLILFCWYRLKMKAQERVNYIACCMSRHPSKSVMNILHYSWIYYKSCTLEQKWCPFSPIWIAQLVNRPTKVSSFRFCSRAAHWICTVVFPPLALLASSCSAHRFYILMASIIFSALFSNINCIKSPRIKYS